jgi:hypothetical protein
MDWSMAQVVEHLLCKYKALAQTPVFPHHLPPQKNSQKSGGILTHKVKLGQQL